MTFQLLICYLVSCEENLYEIYDAHNFLDGCVNSLQYHGELSFFFEITNVDRLFIYHHRIVFDIIIESDSKRNNVQFHFILSPQVFHFWRFSHNFHDAHI